MSNFSDFAPRLLRALAGECWGVAREIGRLGEFLSAGVGDHNAHIVALQSFDYLVQHMDAQAGLIDRLSNEQASVEDMVHAIKAIPLPAVRDRLLLATNMPATDGANEDSTFWTDA
jgi:hypothetical protein